jgi:uncharacterized protein YegP (UPF0339 family)
MRLEVFADDAGSWRWRCRAGNNRVVFTAGESFASKSNAKRAAFRVAALWDSEEELTVDVAE